MNTKYVEVLFGLAVAVALSLFEEPIYIVVKKDQLKYQRAAYLTENFMGVSPQWKSYEKISEEISWGDVHMIFLPGYVNNPLKSSRGSNWIKESFHLKEIWWQNLFALGNPAEKVKVPGSKKIVPATGA